MVTALFFHIVLFILAFRLNRKHWPEQWMINLFCISAYLSLSFFVSIDYLLPPLVVVLFLLLFGCKCPRGASCNSYPINKIAIARSWMGLRREAGVLKRWQALILILAVFLMLLDGLYAAFPFYRPDQWNYHLLLPKLISRYGSLNRVPQFYDHIFFTGAYEYFFIPMRMLLRDDITFQCSVNYFNWFVPAALLPAVVFRLSKFAEVPMGIMTSWAMGFFIFAGLPSRDMIANGKVEPVLFVAAILALNGVLRLISKKSSKGDPVITGILLIAPVGHKLIWLNFLIPVGIVLVLDSCRRQDGFQILGRVLPGAAGGMVLAIPYFAKNQFFFGNVLHPLQLLIFQSGYWSLAHEQYWSVVAGKAVDFRSYIEILVRVPAAIVKELRYLTVAFLAAVLCYRGGFLRSAFGGGPGFEVRKKALNMLGLAFLISLVMWPLLYRHDIYPRFYYPLIALAVVFLILVLRKGLSEARLLPVLLLPVFMSLQAEVKFTKIGQYFLSDPEEFYASIPGPGHFRNDMVAINAHRRVTGADGPGEATPEGVTAVLADEIQGYFLDGLLLRWDSPDFFVLLKKWMPERRDHRACLWAFLNQHGVRYLHAGVRPFADWPAVWQPVIAAAMPVGRGGRIRHLSGAVLGEKAARCRYDPAGPDLWEQITGSYHLEYLSGKDDGSHIKSPD